MAVAYLGSLRLLTDWLCKGALIFLSAMCFLALCSESEATTIFIENDKEVRRVASIFSEKLVTMDSSVRIVFCENSTCPVEYGVDEAKISLRVSEDDAGFIETKLDYEEHSHPDVNILTLNKEYLPIYRVKEDTLFGDLADALLKSLYLYLEECDDCYSIKHGLAKAYYSLSGCFTYDRWQVYLLTFGDAALESCREEFLTGVMVFVSDKNICRLGMCEEMLIGSLAHLLYAIEFSDLEKRGIFLPPDLDSITDPLNRLVLQKAAYDNGIGVIDKDVICEGMSLYLNEEERSYSPVQEEFRALGCE